MTTIPPVVPPVVEDFDSMMEELRQTIDGLVSNVGRGVKAATMLAQFLPPPAGDAVIATGREAAERFGAVIGEVRQTIVTYHDRPKWIWQVSREWQAFHDTVGRIAEEIDPMTGKVRIFWSGDAARAYFDEASYKQRQLGHLQKACAVGPPLAQIAEETATAWGEFVVFLVWAAAETLAAIVMLASGVAALEALAVVVALALTLAAGLYQFKTTMETHWRAFESAMGEIAGGEAGTVGRWA